MTPHVETNPLLCGSGVRGPCHPSSVRQRCSRTSAVVVDASARRNGRASTMPCARDLMHVVRCSLVLAGTPARRWRRPLPWFRE